MLNYARLYGSGIKHAVEHFKAHGVLEKHARELAAKLFAKTKGVEAKSVFLSRLLEP